MKKLLIVLILSISIYTSDFYTVEASNLLLDAYTLKYSVSRENPFNNTIRSVGIVGEHGDFPYSITLGTGKEWCDKFCLNTTFDMGVGKNKIIEKNIWHLLTITNFGLSIPIYTKSNYQFFLRPNLYFLVDSYDIGRIISNDPSYKLDPFSTMGIGLTIGFKFTPVEKPELKDFIFNLDVHSDTSCIIRQQYGE